MTAETHRPGFVCKAAYGLGISSCADFVRAVSAYKPIRAARITYVNASTAHYDRGAGLVVFDGLRQLARFTAQVQSAQVVVISEVVTLLKEVTGIEPLDYLNNRSFEFNFVPVDLLRVVRAVVRRTGQVTVGFVDRDSLGYHIDVAAQPDAFVSAHMSLMANLPFQFRHRVRLALTNFFTASVFDPNAVLAAVHSLDDNALPDEIANFVAMFTSHAERYHTAVRSDKSADWVAKRYDVNAYTIAFLRKMIRSVQSTATKVANHEKVATGASPVHERTEQ